MVTMQCVPPTCLNTKAFWKEAEAEVEREVGLPEPEVSLVQSPKRWWLLLQRRTYLTSKIALSSL